jgi:hypothetical protein
MLSRYGAPKNAIVPGFGMTETCAGAIFNLNFPEYDLNNGYELASLGRCMPGIQMRVMKISQHGERAPALENEDGELEVSGEVVFKQYFNDPVENTRSFTSDGWFKTGDRARLDEWGNLRLVGRSKEVIIINGYSYGAMLAFETAKRLEANKDQVQFLGSFNLPPHIKSRMRRLVWSECLLHLAFFLRLTSEEYAREVSQHVAQLSHSEAVNFVFEIADPAKVK